MLVCWLFPSSETAGNNIKGKFLQLSFIKTKLLLFVLTQCQINQRQKLHPTFRFGIEIMSNPSYRQRG